MSLVENTWSETICPSNRQLNGLFAFPGLEHSFFWEFSSWSLLAASSGFWKGLFICLSGSFLKKCNIWAGLPRVDHKIYHKQTQNCWYSRSFCKIPMLMKICRALKHPMPSQNKRCQVRPVPRRSEPSVPLLRRLHGLICARYQSFKALTVWMVLILVFDLTEVYELWTR